MALRSATQPRAVVALMTGVAAVQAVFGLGFVLQIPAFIGLWPFEGTTPLSHALIGSFFLAAAASTAWCLWQRSERGFVGIALDYIAILAPFALIALGRVLEGAGASFVGFAVATAGGLVFGLALLGWSLSRTWRDERAMPRPVRWSFAVFAVVLAIVGALLVIQVSNVIPWNITPELSTLFGFLFLGAATYFTFGLMEPRWENAGGQLAGFLAYDLVLIVPLLQRFSTVDDRLRPSLWLYTLVVVLSALLAAWYLFLDRDTRMRSGTP